MMARKPAMLQSCILLLLVLSCQLTANSKLAEEASFLSCTCHIPLNGNTTMNGTCSSPFVHIVKHYGPLVEFQQSLFKLASTNKENTNFTSRSSKNATVEFSYREGSFQMTVHYTSNTTGIPGYYSCLRVCLSVESFQYEMDNVKTLIIGPSSSGVLHSFPGGFVCKIDVENITPAGDFHSDHTNTTLILLVKASGIINIILGTLLILCFWDLFKSSCRKATARLISILPSCNWLRSALSPRNLPAKSYCNTQTDVEDEGSIAEHEGGVDERSKTALLVRPGPGQRKTQPEQAGETASDHNVQDTT